MQKRKEGKEGALPTALVKTAEKVQQGLARLAGFLNQKAGALPTRMLKGGLFLFCAAGSIGGGWIIWQSLQQRGGMPLSITPIKVLPLRTVEEKTPVITEKEWSRIQSFGRYLDSLGKTKGGIQQKDSPLQKHGGLLDSLRLLKEVYGEQNQK